MLFFSPLNMKNVMVCYFNPRMSYKNMVEYINCYQFIKMMDEFSLYLTPYC